MQKNLHIIFLFILLSSFSFLNINASDDAITNGTRIMEYLFDQHNDSAFLVKYRKDKNFIGTLLFDENHVGHTLKIFNVSTAEQVFEFKDPEKKLVNFGFKRNAVVIFYKSTFWEEKIAFDLYTGKVVRRYSSWFGY